MRLDMRSYPDMFTFYQALIIVTDFIDKFGIYYCRRIHICSAAYLTLTNIIFFFCRSPDFPLSSCMYLCTIIKCYLRYYVMLSNFIYNFIKCYFLQISSLPIIHHIIILYHIILISLRNHQCYFHLHSGDRTLPKYHKQS